MNELVQALDASGGRLVSWLVPILIASAVVLAAAWLADLVLRRRVSARWRMLLFGAVLLRLALPADLATPIGLRTSARVHSAEMMTSETVANKTLRMPDIVAPAGTPQPATIHPLALIPIAWALGTLVILVALVAGRLRLSRALRDAEPTALVASAPVVFHETLGPAVVGLFAPRIVVPRSLVGAIDASCLADILRHESAHVARRDPWTFALVQIILALAWPVLPAWLAARKLRALAEEACDERAVSGLDGIGRRAYAATLVAVAESMPSPSPSPALGLLMTGARVESRLIALRFTRRWPVTLQAAIVLVATMALLATLGASRVAAGEATGATSGTSNAPVPPRTEVATLQEAAGTVLVRPVESPKWEPATAPMSLAPRDHVRVKEGRARIAYATGDVQEIARGTIVETMAPSSRAATDPGNREMAGNETLYTGKPMSLSLQDADLHELFRLFHDVSGLNIIVDPAVKRRTLKLVEVPWDQAMDLVLRTQGLGRAMEGNVLRIAPLTKLAEEKQRQEPLNGLSRPAEPKQLSAAVIERLEWPLQRLTPEEGTTATVPLLSDRGSVVVDLRTRTLIVEDARDRLDAVRAMLAREDTPARPETGQAMVFFSIAEVSSQWIADHGDVLPASCQGRVNCLDTLAEGQSKSALDEAIQAGEATGDARVLTRPMIAVQDGSPATITSGEIEIDVLVGRDSDRALQVEERRVRWATAQFESRDRLPLGRVEVVLVPLSGDADTRMGLAVIQGVAFRNEGTSADAKPTPSR